MNTKNAFPNSLYDETHLAERELSAFIPAITELFGPEQARTSTEDWLEELELMDSSPRSTSRDWRAVTIATSARLASRLNVAPHHPTFLINCKRGVPRATEHPRQPRPRSGPEIT